MSQFTLIAGRSGVAARIRCLRVEKSYRRLLRPRAKRPYRWLDCDDHVKQSITNTLVECASDGERNPDVLCERALKLIRGEAA